MQKDLILQIGDVVELCNIINNEWEHFIIMSKQDLEMVNEVYLNRVRRYEKERV